MYSLVKLNKLASINKMQYLQFIKRRIVPTKVLQQVGKFTQNWGQLATKLVLAIRLQPVEKFTQTG